MAIRRLQALLVLVLSLFITPAIVWGAGSGERVDSTAAATADTKMSDRTSDSTGKPLVFVSIPPLEYFVRQIAGDQVQIEVLVPAGADPHSYELTPRQMTALSSASLYFSVGIEFEEAFLHDIEENYSRLRIVDTSRGVALIGMSQPHAHDADHEDRYGEEHYEGEDHDDDDYEHDYDEEHHEDDDHDDHEDEHEGHHHDGLDPHIWLDPERVKTMAATIKDSLKEFSGIDSNALDRGYENFVSQLNRLQAKLFEELSPYVGRAFLIYHPSMGYFADAFGLEQVAVEFEGKEPGPAHLEGLMEETKLHNIHTVFVQPQFPKRTADIIAKAINGEVIEIDPLAADWEENLKNLALALKQALK